MKQEYNPMTSTQPVIDMNLTDYLKHKEDCALNKPQFCINCGRSKRKHHSAFQQDCETYIEPVVSCTCSLSSIQSRLVLLPEDFKKKLLELLHEAASTYSRDGGWEKFTALHSDEFEGVAGDIEKMLKG